MEKINVAELLKDCPKGMELDCTIFCGKVTFDGIIEDASLPIQIRVNKNVEHLDRYGCFATRDYAVCVISPKGKTTWEGFVPPCQFKEGDVVTSVFQGVVQGTGIFDYEEQSEAWIHVCINHNDEFSTYGYLGYVYDLRLATEEEKAKLFKVIEDNGYKWNAETKTLEKLIPDKFDINTLVPFESKVLVRGSDPLSVWKPAIFGIYMKDKHNSFYVVGGTCWNQCIPYEGNEHLIGTTNTCNEFYKTWK